MLERRWLLSTASAPVPAVAIPAPPAWAVPSAGELSGLVIARSLGSPGPVAKPATFHPGLIIPAALDPTAMLPVITLRPGGIPGGPDLRTSGVAIAPPAGMIAKPAPVLPPDRAEILPPPPMPVPPFSKVAMAEADFTLAGEVVQGFAFADHDKDQVSVRIGEGPSGVIGSRDDGVRSPNDVKLVDLDGDDVKDLVVANAGADNVLFYAGRDGGSFATGKAGGVGFAVGAGPAGITVGDVDGDGIPDVVVSNRDSNDVTLLLGRGRKADWSLIDAGRLRVGDAPVASLIEDVDRDGFVDILVSNSGSNTVSVLRGLGQGRFDDVRPRVLKVGDGPVRIFLGRFDHGSGLGLLTVNSRSNDLTVISDFLGDHPESRTISSGGMTPTSAFASDLDFDGFTDLVVAHSGDGKLALFRGDEGGLELTSIVTSSTIPTPTAVLPGDQTPDGFEIYAVSAGQDAASIFQFDLGLVAGVGGLGPTVPTAGASEEDPDDGLFAQLISHGDSTFNLVGVLGLASPRDAAEKRSRDDRDEDPDRIFPIRPGVSSLDDEEEYVASIPGPDDDPPDLGPEAEGEASTWARFVLGLDVALDAAREVANDAIAETEAAEDEAGPGRPEDDLALLDLGSPSAQGRADRDATSAVDQAIDSLRPDEAGDDEVPGDDDGWPDADPGRAESIPTVSLDLIFAHQMLIRVAPPHHPSDRRPSPSGPKSGGNLRLGGRRA